MTQSLTTTTPYDRFLAESGEVTLANWFLSRRPASMPDWAFFYGWDEAWRWFPTDCNRDDMDLPHQIAQYLANGARRVVTGAVDYPTREEAMADLRAAWAEWCRRKRGGT